MDPVGDEDHVIGSARAPVTLVEYGDFECPYTADAVPVVRRLLERYGDALRFVFRNFPLPKHPHAFRAAEASEFAADHGRFWEMHDLLFAHQDALHEPDLRVYARRLGLAPAELSHALRIGTYRALLQDVVEAGADAGVDGTPSFFLNGEPFADDPTETNLIRAIDATLRARSGSFT